VRRSKYGAKPTTVDGVRFASQKEARRYVELKMLEKAGEINSLKCQWPYVLSAPQIYVPCTHPDAGKSPIADFIYYDTHGTFHVEDVKGFKTPLYKWKKRHVEAQYGIEIREV
jgi:hypothetical protein